MQEISELHSESPKSHVIHVIAAIGVNTAHVEGAADDLAVGSQTVLSVIAPVGVANVIGVSSAANTGVTSLDLNHDLIDLIELRSGGVERVISLVTSGDTLGSSIATVGVHAVDFVESDSDVASVASANFVVSAASVVSAVIATSVSAAGLNTKSAISAVIARSISAAGLNINGVEGVCSVGSVVEAPVLNI